MFASMTIEMIRQVSLGLYDSLELAVTLRTSAQLESHGKRRSLLRHTTGQAWSAVIAIEALSARRDFLAGTYPGGDRRIVELTRLSIGFKK
jgi:hypothetical protein